MALYTVTFDGSKETRHVVENTDSFENALTACRKAGPGHVVEQTRSAEGIEVDGDFPCVVAQHFAGYGDDVVCCVCGLADACATECTNARVSK